MTDINKYLLSLIKEGKTSLEISNIMGLTPKQIHRRLESIKDAGYNLEKTVLDDGTFEYSIVKGFSETNNHTTKLKLVKNVRKAQVMVVSDIHVGSIKDAFYRMDKVYEYCVDKGINVIINTGDIIDNVNPRRNSYLKTNEEQVEYLVSKHPYDKNIINIVCFGNHDYNPLVTEGLDVSSVLTRQRSDFVSLGYGFGIINVGNSQIITSHKIENVISLDYSLKELSGKLILNGHTHNKGFFPSKNRCRLNVPTLSDIAISSKPSLPGAIVLDMRFNKFNQLDLVDMSHLVMTDDLHFVGADRFRFDNPGPKIIENSINPLCKKLNK